MGTGMKAAENQNKITVFRMEIINGTELDGRNHK
jgi:hypothetical protein